VLPTVGACAILSVPLASCELFGQCCTTCYERNGVNRLKTLVNVARNGGWGEEGKLGCLEERLCQAGGAVCESSRTIARLFRKTKSEPGPCAAGATWKLQLLLKSLLRSCWAEEHQALALVRKPLNKLQKNLCGPWLCLFVVLCQCRWKQNDPSLM